ncbi:MAG: DUF2752 domain-containing protein [Acidobacteria bacterium]|nr:DUF2752 domain-containing protein [Acidobacteriota bacterium]
MLAAGGLTALAAGSGLVWYFDPTKANFFPVCPLYTLTGFACPGCGLTRGFHALFHGDLYTALDFNALIPFFALALLFLVATLVSITVRGKGLVKLSASPGFLFGTLVLVLVFGVARNLPFYPFTFLYP